MACDTTNGTYDFDSLLVDPFGDLDWVEANQVSPFDIRDSPFGDEASDVADVDAEFVGDGGDVDEGTAWLTFWIFVHGGSERVGGANRN